MQSRLAIAGSLAVPAAVAFIVAGVAPEALDPAWWPAALAGVVALVLVAVLRRNLVMLLVAGGLAALGAQSAGQARLMLDVATDAQTDGAFPFFDLTADPMPDPAPPYVSVQGYYRGGWTLDEYAVERGDMPDQSAPPVATLVPFTGSKAEIIELDAEGSAANGWTPLAPGTAIIVVRVAPGTALDQQSASVVRGKTEVLDPEILGTLVSVGGDGAEQARGVLVDTLAIPKPQDAWLELGLALIALGIAVGSAWVASAPREEI
ncbi:MAG: hypothetical protein AAGA54_32830 [Myxococcota bacterium]